ncbi:phage tail protein [Salmonella enterica]
MATKYYAVLTNIGAAKLANATALGAQVEITQMAVGDGNGALPTPNPAQTALVHELRRAPLNTLSIDPNNANQIIAEQVIPEDVGGWWIREIGLFDKDGDMIAVANCAETYKPQLQEGSGRVQVVRMILIVSSTAAVTLKIDPSVVLATRQYVDDAIEAHEQADNPHPQYLQIDNALQEIADAGTAAISNTLKNLSLTGTHFGALLGCKKITSSGTYKASPGTKMVIVELLGGGGAGGGSAASASGKQAFGGGGGAGAYLKTMLTEGFDNVFVTIGAGGTGVTGAEGGNGGDTKFGNNVVAGGGKGGSPMMTQGGGLGGGEGKGGVAYGANIIASTGHAGWSGMAFDVTYAVSGRGAESVLFPGGQASGTQTVNNGYDAFEYGCGGGGACSRSTATAFKGGAGSQGIAIIWEYA